MIRSPGRAFLPRKLLVVAAAAVLLAAGAALALPLLVDVNSYRGLIQQKAEEALGRKVTLGPMKLSVLPTVAIRVERPEVEGLLKADSLAVGVRLMPLLLSGSIDVRRVVLERADLTLTRDEDGSWQLLGPGAPGATTADAPEGGPPAGRSFALASLVVRGASVTVRDARRGGGEPLRVGLDLDGSVRGSTTGDLEVEIDGGVETEGLSLQVRGGVQRRGSSTAFDLLVDRARVDLARASRLASSWGVPWPLPDGLVTSRSLELGGRLAGRLEDGRLASLDLADVVVRDAAVTLARDRGGRWNFESLTEAPGGGSAGDAGGPAPAPAITVKNLRLADARVALRDEAGGPRPVELSLEKVSLVVQELAPDRPVRLELEAEVNPGGGSIRAGGSLPPLTGAGRDVPIDAEASLDGIEVAGIRPYLAAAIGIEPESGRASASVTMKGTYPARLAAAGRLDLDALELAGSDDSITGTLSFDLTAAEGGSQVRFDKLEAAVGDSRVALRGSIDGRGGRKVADVEILPASLDASDLARMLRLAGASVPVEFSAGRPVTLQGRVRGDLGRPRELDLSGRVEVADLTLRHASMTRPLEQVRGTLTLKRDGFDVSGFSAVIGGSDVAGSLSAERLEAPRVTFALTSRRADFWELMSFMKEEPARAAGAGGPSQTAGDDSLAKVSARGTLQIGEGTFGEVAFRDLKTTLALEGRTLRLDPIGMALYGGGMTGSASLDLRANPPVCTIAARASGIDADPLLAAGAGLQGVLAGRLSGDLSVTASGSDQQAIVRSARGGGTLRVQDGHAGALNVLKILSRATDVMGERSLNAVSAKLSEQGTDFSDLSATLEVAGGKIRAKRFSLTTPDLELVDDGTLDMSAGTIEVEGEIVFSQGLSQAMVDEGSKAADYFWDTKRGRVNLPVTLAGPIAAPRPSIDWSTAGRQLARRRVHETLRGRLAEAGLSELVGGGASTLPERRRSGAATGTGAPATEEKSVAPAAPRDGRPGDGSAQRGGIAITLDEHDFSGNFLLPDLKLKGTLRGTDISGATVSVGDEKGRVLHEESLDGKIGRFYETRDRSAPAVIPFRLTVEGKRIAASRRGVTVTIVARDASGATSTRSFQVER